MKTLKKSLISAASCLRNFQLQLDNSHSMKLDFFNSVKWLGLDQYHAGSRYPIPDTIGHSCTDTDTNIGNVTHTLGHMYVTYAEHTIPMFQFCITSLTLSFEMARSGFCSAADRERLDSFLRRCKRLRYSDNEISEVVEMFESTDEALFSRIIRNDKHVLKYYLPERHKIQYNLRPQQHSKQLI